MKGYLMLLALFLSFRLLHSLPNNFSNTSTYNNLDDQFKSSLDSNQHCKQQGTCKHLANATCLGVKLPYSSIYINPELFRTFDEVEEKLNSLKGLSQIPKCWTLIQPFLCSLYMPKCQNNLYDLPSQEMCKMLLSPCRFLLLKEEFEFLKCENTTKYPPKCGNSLRELKFNSSGQCQLPLVATDNAAGFYQFIDGCGVSCINPYFTESEQRQIHQFIAWAATICFMFNFFSVMTYIIDWPLSNKYPSLTIFYINCCFMMSCFGWLAQFLPGARDDIICRKDGTLRMSEPSAGENLSCVAIFILVYYFLIAASVWFVIFTYALFTKLNAFGKMKEKVDKNGAYFHMVAWSLPLVLTITIMALCEIDGNSVTGICFVGYINYQIRAVFLLGPIIILFPAGAYFIIRGMIILFSVQMVQIKGQDINSEQNKTKIRDIMVRVGLFYFFTFIFLIVTFLCQIYEFQYHDEWKENFKQYILCKILKNENCKMKSRPSLAILQAQLLILFLSGISMSFLLWNSSTLTTWQRFIKRLRNSEVEKEPIKVSKHKIIAQAFAKRKTLHRAGRLSISFHNTQEDPVGLNLRFDSNGSQELSTSWAAALPKLMNRRGALIGVDTGSFSSQRRNSLDSEISFSVRRMSIESRRHSLDSQISVQFTEMTATRKSSTTPLPTCGGGKRYKKRRRHSTRHQSSHVESVFVGRGSTTSQESQVVIFQNSNMNNLQQMMPNLKRRLGNAGIDLAMLTSSLQNQSLEDPSDNEDDEAKEVAEALLPQIQDEPKPTVKYVDQSTQVSPGLWKTTESSDGSLDIF